MVPASRSARTSRPGRAPMYVRRWPRISASSRTPPSDMRTNLRPVARAIDSPIEVLPVPGGPISVRMAPERRSSATPRSGAQLAHGQVLDDARLHVVEAGVVGVEHLARVHRIEPLLGALRPTARRAASRGRCGSSTTRRSTRPCARAAPSSRSACSRTSLRHAGVGDLLAVLVGDRRLVLAELLADRVHLPAQEVLALLLLRAGLDVLADALAHLQLGEPLAAGGAARASAARRRRAVSSSPTFCVEGEVGRVAATCRPARRARDRARTKAPSPRRRRRAARGSPPRRRGTRARARASGPAAASRPDARRPPRAGRRPGRCARRPATPRWRPARTRPAAARQANPLHDLGDGADGGVVSLVPRDEDDAVVVADVGRECDVHAREHNGALERDE